MSQQPQLTIPGPVATERIVKEQRVDGDTQTVILQAQQGLPVSGRYSAVRSQLAVSDGVLCRSLKLPLEGVFQVPIVPGPLVCGCRPVCARSLWAQRLGGYILFAP